MTDLIILPWPKNHFEDDYFFSFTQQYSELFPDVEDGTAPGIYRRLDGFQMYYIYKVYPVRTKCVSTDSRDEVQSCFNFPSPAFDLLGIISTFARP